MTIKNKTEYYRLAYALGNQPRTFGDVGEVDPASLPDIPLALRSVERVGGVFLPMRKRDVPRHNSYGYRLRVNETFPIEWVIAQGEVARTPDWHLSYSTDKMFFREAMQSRTTLDGYTAKLWMQGLMQEEFQHIEVLMEMFPDATIEWGWYSKPVGTWNSRLVLWEVRDY